MKLIQTTGEAKYSKMVKFGGEEKEGEEQRYCQWRDVMEEEEWQWGGGSFFLFRFPVASETGQNKWNMFTFCSYAYLCVCTCVHVCVIGACTWVCVCVCVLCQAKITCYGDHLLHWCVFEPLTIHFQDSTSPFSCSRCALRAGCWHDCLHYWPS